MVDSRHGVQESIPWTHSSSHCIDYTRSYAQIAETVSSAVPAVKAFNPDIMVAIGGGGFIPARMLRTEVKSCSP
jgi:alcohol dehydrogenase class IV